MTIGILDASGREMESHENMNGRLVFGKDWTPGVYLARIGKKDEVLVIKIVKAP